MKNSEERPGWSKTRPFFIKMLLFVGFLSDIRRAGEAPLPWLEGGESGWQRR